MVHSPVRVRIPPPHAALLVSSESRYEKAEGKLKTDSLFSFLVACEALLFWKGPYAFQVRLSLSLSIFHLRHQSPLRLPLNQQKIVQRRHPIDSIIIDSR